MSPERIKQILTEPAFQPFTIHTGDGGRVDVLSKELAFPYPGGRTLRVLTPRVRDAKREGQFDEQVIDVFLITKVTVPANDKASA